MIDTPYGFRVRLRRPYEETIHAAIEALAGESFGVLHTLDLQETLKRKLDLDFRRYVILGACSPPLAARALEAELESGLLLPCNVIVYEDGPGHSVVAAVAPFRAAEAADHNPALTDVAREAEVRLRRALTSLEAPAAGFVVHQREEAPRGTHEEVGSPLGA
jgi:uncharacterized protein (DUF302 family)